ncbi:MAG: SDR family oxidoreductase [Woeseiaceae bacterium]|nr:SDR family oxidoreductase [Woeseiaceae bacterium]
MTNVLITGGGRGIGLELCRLYRERGASVIAACRRRNADLEALDVRVIEGIDVTSDEAVAGLARDVGDGTLDILVNNAGILYRDGFDELDYDGMVEQYRVNALGPLRVTRALVGSLKKNAKVGIVSSRVGSIADNSSGGNYGYRASKAAVNMIGTNLSHDLGRRGIAVALLHPGFVATDMTGGSGIAPAEAAAGLIERLDELTLETSGGFWHANGERLPW